jgi:prepilin-type N-terminal cleavage/methylation domain-containing protein
MNTGFSRPDPGFTLIELLAALAVGSLLLVMLGAILTQLRSAWMGARETTARVRQESVGLSRLQALVAAGLPADPLSKETAFEGDDDSFRLRTLPPQAFATMGLVWAELRIIRERDGGSLVQLSLTNGSNNVGPETLLRSPMPLRWRYTMRDAQGAVSQTDQAAATGQLPVMILLEQLAPASRAVRRRMALVPQNDTDGRCLFDPVSFACRI